MLEMLRLDGPATSTTVAARIGMNTGTVSYHLRQLARHGFIEDHPGVGTRRDRWWRASHESTSIPSARAAASDDDVRARQAYNHAVVLTQVARLQESLLERTELPRRWAAVTDDSDWTLWLTPRQASELMDKVHEVLRGAAEAAPREKDAGAKGSAQYSVNLDGFPRPVDSSREHGPTPRRPDPTGRPSFAEDRAGNRKGRTSGLVVAQPGLLVLVERHRVLSRRLQRLGDRVPALGRLQHRIRIPERSGLTSWLAVAWASDAECPPTAAADDDLRARAGSL